MTYTGWLRVMAVVYLVLVWSLALWDFARGPQSNGALILASCASAIILALLWLNYKWPSNFRVSAIFLISVSILFALLFSLPMASNNEEDKICQNVNAATQLDDRVLELVKSEHDKAVAEITQRLGFIDQWLNNKFILVGGLFAAFLAYLSQFIRSATQLPRDKGGYELTEHVDIIFKTILPGSVLGMACVVSLAIDIHIGSNIIFVQQLGLWIQHCVENVLDNSANAYMGWENFLYDRGKHIYRYPLFNIVTAPHFFTSVLLYVAYVGCLFRFVSQSISLEQLRASVFIFVLVHVALAIFAFWFSGRSAGIVPLLLCLLVAYLAFARLLTLYRHCNTAGAHFDRSGS